MSELSVLDALRWLRRPPPDKERRPAELHHSTCAAWKTGNRVDCSCAWPLPPVVALERP